MDITTYLPQFRVGAYYEWEQVSDWDLVTDKPRYTWTPVLLLNASTPDDIPFMVNRIAYRVAYAHIRIVPGRSSWPSAQVYRVTDDWTARDNVTPAAHTVIHTRISEIFVEIAAGDRTHIQGWQRTYWLNSLAGRVADATAKLTKALADHADFSNSIDFMPPHEVTEVR